MSRPQERDVLTAITTLRRVATLADLEGHGLAAEIYNNLADTLTDKPGITGWHLAQDVAHDVGATR